MSQCDTIRRLDAIRPGECIRYAEYTEEITGPMCRALIMRIDAFAAELERAGRITRRKESERIKDNRGHMTLMRYFATGTERP